MQGTQAVHQQHVNCLIYTSLNLKSFEVAQMHVPIITLDYLPCLPQTCSGSHLGAVPLHRPELRHVLPAG